MGEARFVACRWQVKGARMKRNHTKLRALIRADAKNNVGGLGAILEMIVTPSSGKAPLANSSFNRAYGQFLFGGDFRECDVSALFESLLRKLPEENADDLRKIFMLAYFEGAIGAGRELAIDDQRAIQGVDRRRGGKIRGAVKAREAKERWQDKALIVAQEYQRLNPDEGALAIATEITKKLPDIAPGERQIMAVISGWQKKRLIKAIRPRSRTGKRTAFNSL